MVYKFLKDILPVELSIFVKIKNNRELILFSNSLSNVIGKKIKRNYHSLILNFVPPIRIFPRPVMVFLLSSVFTSTHLQ